MSMRETKAQLIRLLEDEDNKVLALSGKWGTGKTHIWREVRAEARDEKVRDALYVSLFGLADMGQIKLKIVQSALPNAGDGSSAWRAIGDSVKAAKKVLVSVHEGFSALDELALLAVPKILKGRVIVLDDIERKHNDLSIDEVLGFIDEFTQMHDARFVLVLNSDQLDDQEVWNTLREKVVDQEIRLNTSSDEAFDIAIGLTPSCYSDPIRKAIQICRVTNIRVIRKVIKAVNQILRDRNKLPAAVLERVVPSTVLLAAINYKGMENGPDFAYVVAAGGLELDDPHEPDDSSRQRKKLQSIWDQMLSELCIVSSDEYELLVVEFLQSGLFDTDEVAKIIDRYLAQNDALIARSEANSFLDRLVWDHRLTDGQLLEQALDIKPKVRFLDASFVTALATEVSKLAEGQAISDEFIEEWLNNLAPDYSPDPDDELFFHRPLHPRIKEAFSERVERVQERSTLLDTCRHIAQHSGWGTRQELVMKSATTDDFERTIRSLDVPDLKVLMRKMLELCANRSNYLGHFGSAMDRFAEACRNIAEDEDSARLSKLIRGLFGSYKLEVLLTPQPRGSAVAVE